MLPRESNPRLYWCDDTGGVRSRRVSRVAPRHPKSRETIGATRNSGSRMEVVSR